MCVCGGGGGKPNIFIHRLCLFLKGQNFKFWYLLWFSENKMGEEIFADILAHPSRRLTR